MSTTIDYCELAVPGVHVLQPYQPGKPIEELQRELGLAEIVKLASNENPLGPSPLVLTALHKLDPELARYPDGNGYVLKAALSKKLNVDISQITLGNGSNDVLEIIARTFVQPSQQVIYSRYAFAVYPIVTQAIGAKHGVVDAIDWGHDLAGMLTRIDKNTRLIFIANPNNPTGTWLTREQLIEFLDQVPANVIVVLDEAYYEYAHHPAMKISDFPDGMTLLPDYPNLIVTRTFSKAYGLAGLRVGYAVASPVITNLLNRVRQPFNVNSYALHAAAAALDDQTHLQKSVQNNVDGMAQLIDAFEGLGLDFIPSAGNFISVDMAREAGPLYRSLLQRGVIVRPVANYAMPTHLRISIGTKQENTVFIHALEQVLSQ